MRDSEHVPVLAERCLALLGPALSEPGAVLVDGTVGLGGHAQLFLEGFPKLTVVGIDRDPQALQRSRVRLSGYADRVRLVHARDAEIGRVLSDLGIDHADGVLLDLGVSSMQLDLVDRGFAYSVDAPLDMRMDPTNGATAADVLNTYPPGELVRILRQYGEERFAPRIVAAVVRERQRQPLRTSAELVELVRNAIPAAARRHGGNPAKRTFQALRIEVNAELSDLPVAVAGALASLDVGGRIAVLSYHSLEDRIVKQAFARQARPSVPDDLPVIPDDARPSLRLLTRGAEVASSVERAANPRAASARLRAAERIRLVGEAA